MENKSENLSLKLAVMKIASVAQGKSTASRFYPVGKIDDYFILGIFDCPEKVGRGDMWILKGDETTCWETKRESEKLVLAWSSVK